MNGFIVSFFLGPFILYGAVMALIWAWDHPWLALLALIGLAVGGFALVLFLAWLDRESGYKLFAPREQDIPLWIREAMAARIAADRARAAAEASAPRPTIEQRWAAVLAQREERLAKLALQAEMAAKRKAALKAKRDEYLASRSGDR